MNIKKQNMYNFIILIVLTWFFLVPRTLIQHELVLERFEIWDKIMPPFAILIFILLLFLSNKKINFKIVLYLILLIFFGFMNIKIYYYLLTYLIAYFIIKSDLNYTWNKNILAIIVFAGVSWQIIYYRYFGNFVVSLKDPNYSSFFLFLAYIYIYSRKSLFFKLLSFIVLFFGFLTGSRNFLVCLIFYFIFSFDFTKSILNYFKLNSYKKLIYFSLILVILLGGVFLIFTNNMGGEKIDDRINILNIFDGSNQKRFYSNFYLIRTIDERILLNNEHEWNNNLPKPHNFVFRSIVMYGLLSTIIIINMNGYIFDYYINNKNLNIFMGIITYLMFLGEVTSLFWLVLESIYFKEFEK
jgi:hypothetical protein